MAHTLTSEQPHLLTVSCCLVLFVIVGIAGAGVSLVGGLWAFRSGRSQMSQYFQRARVGFQVSTVLFFVCRVYLYICVIRHPLHTITYTAHPLSRTQRILEYCSTHYHHFVSHNHYHCTNTITRHLQSLTH